MITLSICNTIDAGATGLQTVTAGDIDSEEATEYELLKADGNGGASWGRATAGDIADNNQVGQYLGSTGYGFSAWKKLEIAGTLVTSGGATAGQVLTADGSNGASWQNAAGGDVEGTSIKSTGATANHVLTADGSGGASWAAPVVAFRIHNITMTDSTLTYSNFRMNCTILSRKTQAYTRANIATLLYNNQMRSATAAKVATGAYVKDSVYYDIIGIYATSGAAAGLNAVTVNRATGAIGNASLSTIDITDKFYLLPDA